MARKETQQMASDANEQAQLARCVVCMDDVNPNAKGVSTLECGLVWCNGCLNDALQRATSSRADWPAKCCDGHNIEGDQLLAILPALSKQLRGTISEKMEELENKLPVYCPKPECGMYIPESRSLACSWRTTCLKQGCDTWVCKACQTNEAAHTWNSDKRFWRCPDTLGAENRKLIAEGKIQKCPRVRCRTLVEKTEGCDHMVCPNCEIDFCYLCSLVLAAPFYQCPCGGGAPRMVEEDEEEEEEEEETEEDVRNRERFTEILRGILRRRLAGEEALLQRDAGDDAAMDVLGDNGTQASDDDRQLVFFDEGQEWNLSRGPWTVGEVETPSGRILTIAIPSYEPNTHIGTRNVEAAIQRALDDATARALGATLEIDGYADDGSDAWSDAGTDAVPDLVRADGTEVPDGDRQIRFFGPVRWFPGPGRGRIVRQAVSESGRILTIDVPVEGLQVAEEDVDFALSLAIEQDNVLDREADGEADE